MGKKILGEAGHEVMTVSNGAAAMKKISEERPDLIILDIYMPGYTGLEVCQRVKESRDIARTPVLLTVGKLEPFKKDDARRVRAEAVVVKPFEASELMAAVNKIAEYVVSRPAESKKTSLKERAEKARVASDQWDTSDAVAPVPKPPEISEPAGQVEHGSSGYEVSTAGGSQETPEPVPMGSAAPEIEEPSQVTGFGQGGRNGSAAPAASADQPLAVEQHDPELLHLKPLARAAAAGVQADFASTAPSSAHIGEERFDQGMGPEFSTPAPQSAGDADPVPLIPTSFLPTEMDCGAADPAFIADRNQGLNSFPTHFGIKEPEREADAAPPAALGDDFESALANLPGEGSAGPASTAPNAWIAEELPIEAGEEGVMLEEEMSQAQADSPADADHTSLREFEVTPVQSTPSADLSAVPDKQFAGGESAIQSASATDLDACETGSAGAAGIPAASDTNTAFAAASDRGPAGESIEPAPGTAAAPSTPMAAADMAALESIVARVLEQLKPKIVAEIAREIAAGKK
jgi:CheY-like chemotaxis protein